MDDHSVNDGEHGGMIAEELMEAGTGQSGLDRRRLLGGVVAGAAGLLLPGQGTTAQTVSAIGAKRIRLTVDNQWLYPAPINYYWWDYGKKDWFRSQAVMLPKGQKTSFEEPSIPWDETARVKIEIDNTPFFTNNPVLFPVVGSLAGMNYVEVGNVSRPIL